MKLDDKHNDDGLVPKRGRVVREVLQGIMWLLFAAHEGFNGFVLLSTTHSFLAYLSGLVSVMVAIGIVVVHFIAAYRGTN